MESVNKTKHPNLAQNIIKSGIKKVVGSKGHVANLPTG